MKKNRILTAALAGALSLSLAAPAFGATWTQNVNVGGSTAPSNAPVEEEKNWAGHTTVSIVTANAMGNTAGQLSFTAPLYVTLAVINNNPTVQVPNNYVIQNTGRTTAFVVSKMTFQKLQGATFSTVGSANPTGNYDIRLKFGSLFMPDTKNTYDPVNVPLVGDTQFYNTNGRPKVFTANTQGKMTIQWSGDVKSATRVAAASAPQFRVKFTVTATDAQGNPIVGGFTYLGDSSNQAGLGIYNVNTDTYEQKVTG